ncbi:MAG: asparagine--tRNA ligase, partial [Flavobacteriaceae bacterium]|nr:asparagine--tRNA ligase [Flavobacteriaceae bacterium]
TDHNMDGFETASKKIHTGSCVGFIGKLVQSPGKGQSVELQANSIEVYGEADPEYYPLQKKHHSFEFLREIAHLRPRTNTFGAVMRVRNRLSYAIHNFFQDQGFVYLHTPIITANDCEGAGEIFQVTTLNPGSPPMLDGSVDYSQDFFGEKTGLTVSGQLEGEVFAMALSEIYTFGPTFRAENSNTSRHLSEFWMVEPEMAFYDLEDDMGLAENFLRYLLKDALENCSEDLEFFDKQIDKTILGRHREIVDKKFERISYSEAVQLLEKSNKKFNYSVKWGSNLQSEHERYISEEVFNNPVIIYNYPEEIKPFYMKINDDGKTVRAMDVLLPKLGEIIGGSQREDDYDVLVKRMKSKNLNSEDYNWYLDLRRFGSAPHAGFGLGFERLVQFVTGIENIRDVIPFPRTPKNARF